MRHFSTALMSICLVPLSYGALQPRESDDPAVAYLLSMCFPHISNDTWRASMPGDDPTPSLADSPFPCEQARYLNAICAANGTTAIDFLAEQECLCNGSYFEVVAGCYECQLGHGSLDDTREQASSTWSSYSAAECGPTPPSQPFENVWWPLDSVDPTEAPPLSSLGSDQFPSQTAVSNYFTLTKKFSAGEITGSATARLASFTNSNYVRYTPTTTYKPTTTYTTIPTSATSKSSGSAAASSGQSSTTAASSSSTASPNGAATTGLGLVGGFLAAGLGMAAML